MWNTRYRILKLLWVVDPPDVWIYEQTKPIHHKLSCSDYWKDGGRKGIRTKEPLRKPLYDMVIWYKKNNVRYPCRVNFYALSTWKLNSLHFVANAVFALPECTRHFTPSASLVHKAFGLFVKCSHHKDFLLFFPTISIPRY